MTKSSTAQKLKKKKKSLLDLVLSDLNSEHSKLTET